MHSIQAATPGTQSCGQIYLVSAIINFLQVLAGQSGRFCVVCMQELTRSLEMSNRNTKN